MSDLSSCRQSAHSKPVEDAKSHVCIVVLRMRMLGVQIAICTLNREGDSRTISNLVEKPAASEKDVLASMKVMLILGDPGRKIIALIVKV